MTDAASAERPRHDTNPEREQSPEPALLDVRDLVVHFPLPRRHPFASVSKVHAVDGVSFTVKKGRTCGLVGESGSGKTTVALSVMRLTPITSGSVYLNGTPVHDMKGEALRRQRASMQMVFQDPYASLDPRVRAGDIVASPLRQVVDMDQQAIDQRVSELFRLVGLRPEQRALFPHQFSGGQRQRVGIARALATQPGLLVCDEPVSALDVAIQAQILNLLKRLQQEFDLGYLFISHDLGVVQHLCDEVAVMYLGQIVEHANRRALFGRPLHPYTWALLSAVPSADPALRNASNATKAAGRARQQRVRLSGEPPSPIDPPSGCRFASRCPFAEARCREETPVLRPIDDNRNGTRMIACHFVGDDGSTPQERA